MSPSHIEATISKELEGIIHTYVLLRIAFGLTAFHEQYVYTYISNDVVHYFITNLSIFTV